MSTTELKEDLLLLMLPVAIGLGAFGLVTPMTYREQLNDRLKKWVKWEKEIV